MILRFFLFALLLPISVLAREPLDHPNIVVIFFDDLGYGFLNHSGNPTVESPEVSQLVREGANFTQFYCASPACSASRYALLTGRHPARSGLGTWVIGPGAGRYLHPNEFTLAEGLRERGYATGFFGKWHLGTPNGNNGMAVDALPLAHGFDVWEGTNVSHDYGSGVDLIRSKPSGSTPVAGYETIETDILGHVALSTDLTRRYRDKAVAFIEENKDDPFLLYIAPNQPHLPVYASDAFQGESIAGLFGDMIAEIDDLVGTVRQAIVDQGIAENTLIVLSSDNGQWILYEDTASHGKYGEARLLVSTARPFRDGKGSTWEGGMRVPGIMWWPGTIEAGAVVQQPVSTLDVLPTVFALAGEALPTDRSYDGRDIRPYLNPTEFTDSVEEFTLFYPGGRNQVRAVRRGPWKLHISLYSQTGNDWGFSASPANPLLFQLEQDPGETIDVSGEHATETSALQQLIEDFNGSLSSEGTFWD